MNPEWLGNRVEMGRQDSTWAAGVSGLGTALLLVRGAGDTAAQEAFAGCSAGGSPAVSCRAGEAGASASSASRSSSSRDRSFSFRGSGRPRLGRLGSFMSSCACKAGPHAELLLSGTTNIAIT